MLEKVDSEDKIDAKEKNNQKKLIYNAAFKEVAR